MPLVSRETSSLRPPTVSRETETRLKTFVELLLRWNRTVNLISRFDEPAIWDRHIADSLFLLPLLPAEFSHGIDIGSGGGFPGLVLAIASGRLFHLVEADNRKAAFLREAVRATAAPATVHVSRAETVHLPRAPLITARAVAPLPTLLGWAARLLAPGGVCLFPKGRSAEDELTAAAAQWHMRAERFASPTDRQATLLRISEIHRVGQHS